MTRPDAAWLAFWATFGLGAYAADRRGVALCSSARHLFRTHTRTGRAIFAAAYGAGAVILYAHVTNQHPLDRSIRALDGLRR